MTATRGRGRGRGRLERVAGVVGLVLVLSAVPAASTAAQTAPAEFVGYNAAANGTALSAFPSVPALLPVEVPFEATISLATATLSSGGQGFGRASTFFPGTPIIGIRPLIETAAGVRLPIPDYPIVVESREFEDAKHNEQPGLTMSTDVDPDRAAAIADSGAVGLPAVVGVRSLRTESTAVLAGTQLTSTSTSTANGIEVGELRIASVVSTSTVTTDGIEATCATEVVVSGVTVSGTKATIDDDGIHVDDDTPVPGLGVGRTIADALAATGLRARVIGGIEECEGNTGSSTATGLLISLPLPALGAIPAGGGLSVTFASTSATAGASSLPPLDDPPDDTTPVLGDVLTQLPSPFTSPTSSPVASSPGGSNPRNDVLLPADPVAYAFDGVPVGLLAGLLLLAVPAATRVRRYMRRILALADAT